MFHLVVVLMLSLGVAYGQNTTSHLPVVIWHGMGDTCCNPLSMGRIMDIIDDQYPGIYMRSLEIGDNFIEDMLRGFFSNMNKVIDDVCEEIDNDPMLANGFNALGFSQGSQFLRAVVQRCGNPRTNNLISIGGQHQGVYGLPGCPGDVFELCDLMRELLTIGAYQPGIQDRLVQAQYWHDPVQEDDYKELSIFLADINQENFVNETYREGILELDNLVLVRFNKDSLVQPVTSQWFGFYHEGQGTTTYTLQESELYLEDKLGLKQLDEEGRIHFLELEEDHLDFSNEWFIENIVIPFL